MNRSIFEPRRVPLVNLQRESELSFVSNIQLSTLSSTYERITTIPRVSRCLTTMRLLLLSLILCGPLTTGDCLQFLKVDVPEVVDPRTDEVTLRCEYDLDGEELYSVKWYKDGYEFYTFMPSMTPPGRDYDVEGVKVAVRKSDSKQVVILGQALSTEKRINFTGLYGCEVSVEAPSYSTAFGSEIMSVAVLPHQDPALDGLRLRTHYDVGDILKVNCTSAPSFPQATLSFLLNHKEVERKLTRKLAGVGPIDGNLVSSSRLGLIVKLEREHFPGGNLSLICRSKMASVPGGEERNSEAIVTLAASNERLAQEPPRPGSESSSTRLSLFSHVFIIATSLLCPNIFLAI